MAGITTRLTACVASEPGSRGTTSAAQSFSARSGLGASWNSTRSPMAGSCSAPGTCERRTKTWPPAIARHDSSGSIWPVVAFGRDEILPVSRGTACTECSSPVVDLSSTTHRSPARSVTAAPVTRTRGCLSVIAQCHRCASSKLSVFDTLLKAVGKSEVSSTSPAPPAYEMHTADSATGPSLRRPSAGTALACSIDTRGQGEKSEV